MKKIFFMIIFFIILDAKTNLWIYTDLSCDRPIETVKTEFEVFYPYLNIKILKAPISVLLKKINYQKKADILITDKLNVIKQNPELFTFFRKRINMKKLAFFFKKKSKYSLISLKKRGIKIGLAKQDTVLGKITKDMIINYGGKRLYLIIYLLESPVHFKQSSQCFNALFKNKVDICVDWIGTGFWKKYKNIDYYVINDSRLYHEKFSYAVITKYSKHKILAEKFINFANRRFMNLGNKKKKINLLFPDLQFSLSQ